MLIKVSYEVRNWTSFLIMLPHSYRGHFWHPILVNICHILDFTGLLALFVEIANFAKIASLQGATFGIQFKSPFSPLHAFLGISVLRLPSFIPLFQAGLVFLLHKFSSPCGLWPSHSSLALLHSWRKILTIQLPPSVRQTLLTLSRCGLHTHSLR